MNDSYGAIAQLVERLHGMEEVRSSILLGSTPREVSEGPVSDWSLAGFVAGEGSFMVTKQQPGFADGDPRLRFVFAVCVAERDRDLLERLQRRLGFGSICLQRSRRLRWQPTTTLTVNSRRAHRLSVIPFMDRHLLPSAKRDQFDQWVAAMDAYDSEHPTRWGMGPSTCRIDGCEKPVRGRGLCRSHYYRATGH